MENVITDEKIYIGEKSKYIRGKSIESDYMDIKYNHFDNLLNDASFFSFLVSISILDAKRQSMSEVEFSKECDNIFFDLIQSVDEYDPTAADKIVENINQVAEFGQTGQAFKNSVEIMLDKLFITNALAEVSLGKLNTKYQKLKLEAKTINQKSGIDRSFFEREVLEFKKSIINAGKNRQGTFYKMFNESLESVIKKCDTLFREEKDNNYKPEEPNQEQSVDVNVNNELEELATNYKRLRRNIDDCFESKSFDPSDVDMYLYKLREIANQIDGQYHREIYRGDIPQREIDEKYRSYFGNHPFDIIEQNKRAIKRLEEIQEFYNSRQSFHM